MFRVRKAASYASIPRKKLPSCGFNTMDGLWVGYLFNKLTSGTTDIDQVATCVKSKKCMDDPPLLPVS